MKDRFIGERKRERDGRGEGNVVCKCIILGMRVCCFILVF